MTLSSPGTKFIKSDFMKYPYVQNRLSFALESVPVGVIVQEKIYM